VSDQALTDRANAAFWDELCGTSMAQVHGVTDSSPESLARFDRAYLDFYPYLSGYLPVEMTGERTLEIGLGYGTLGQLIAERGADYHGLDIAEGPVAMMRERLARLGVREPQQRVRVGSALRIPHHDASFDRVVSVGALHHTGDLTGAVGEVRRVLRPGGSALVMVYNRRSARRAGLWLRGLPSRLRGRGAEHEAAVRRRYDHNSEGGEAPATEFVTASQARALFGGFDSVRVRRENFDHLRLGPWIARREQLLGAPARLAGLDLYLTAVK